jgi:hypothetical protein
VDDWPAAVFDGSVKFVSIPPYGKARLVLVGVCAGMKRPCMQRGNASKGLSLLCLCVDEVVMMCLTLYLTTGAMTMVALVMVMTLTMEGAGLLTLTFSFSEQCRML